MMDTGLGVVGEVLHAPVQGVPGVAARAIVGAYGFAYPQDIVINEIFVLYLHARNPVIAMPGRPIETPSFLRYPLSHVLATGSHVKVLRWLVRQGRPLATSQLARLAGLSTQGVRNVLAALTSQGLISTLGEGRAQVHALRQQHPLGPALLALFEAERSRWLALTEGLQRVLRERGGVRAAWVYGSVARSGDQPGSDLDLVVVLDDDAPQERASELRDALAEFGRHQDVHVSSVLLSMNDALDPVRSSSPWWKSVVQDAWPLIGPDPLALSSPQLRSRPATSDVAS